MVIDELDSNTSVFEKIRGGVHMPSPEMQDFADWYMEINHSATRGGGAICATREFLRNSPKETQEQIWTRYQIERES